MNRTRVIDSVLVLALLASLSIALPLPADAHFTDSGTVYQPYGGIFNGYKIYLSPSSQTGNIGCNGVSEQTMARTAASHMTSGDYYLDVFDPTFVWRNLRGRGYMVRIGKSTVTNRIHTSNEWAANLHIPVHSNANSQPCNSTQAHLFGTLTCFSSYGSTNGEGLANHLAWVVGSEFFSPTGNQYSPGTTDIYSFNGSGHPCWNPSTGQLGELWNTNAKAAYLESEYHTWNTGTTWVFNSFKWAWRVGVGVDRFLNYPYPRPQ